MSQRCLLALAIALASSVALAQPPASTFSDEDVSTAKHAVVQLYVIGPQNETKLIGNATLLGHLQDIPLAVTPSSVVAGALNSDISASLWHSPSPGLVSATPTIYDELEQLTFLELDDKARPWLPEFHRTELPNASQPVFLWGLKHETRELHLAQLLSSGSLSLSARYDHNAGLPVFDDWGRIVAITRSDSTTVSLKAITEALSRAGHSLDIRPIRALGLRKRACVPYEHPEPTVDQPTQDLKVHPLDDAITTSLSDTRIVPAENVPNASSVKTLPYEMRLAVYLCFASALGTASVRVLTSTKIRNILRTLLSFN